MKSTVEEIRDRFDNDVERFSNLETGQAVTIDAPLHLELLTQAAAVTAPHARQVLDIGCGAGNYSLKLLQRLPDRDFTLLDLSRPMLDRAAQRVGAATAGNIVTVQSDIREADLGASRFDIIMAAQCLHHLRAEAEWRDVFKRIYAALKIGGSFWIADTLIHEGDAVARIMQDRFGDHLIQLGGGTLRDKVFAYVEKEDTPRPLTFQLDLLREVGFTHIDVLHKHNRFASFGGVKA